MCRFLLNNNASLEIKNFKGNTPLDFSKTNTVTLNSITIEKEIIKELENWFYKKFKESTINKTNYEQLILLLPGTTSFVSDESNKCKKIGELICALQNNEITILKELNSLNFEQNLMNNLDKLKLDKKRIEKIKEEVEIKWNKLHKKIEQQKNQEVNTISISKANPENKKNKGFLQTTKEGIHNDEKKYLLGKPSTSSQNQEEKNSKSYSKISTTEACSNWVTLEKKSLAPPTESIDFNDLKLTNTKTINWEETEKHEKRKKEEEKNSWDIKSKINKQEKEQEKHKAKSNYMQ